MAISLTASVSTFTPGYNPVRYLLTSTNVNEKGFRYLVQVFPSGSTTSIFEKRYPPRPSDNYGEVDITRELQSYLSTSDVLTLTSSQSTFNNTGGATQSYYKYDISFGEEYVPTWRFIDQDYVSDTVVKLNSATGLTNGGFVAGDYVNVTLGLTSAAYSTVEGFHVIDSVSGPTATPGYINIIVQGASTSGPSGVLGYVSNSTNTKTQYTGLTGLSGSVVFNGAFDLAGLRGYTASTYAIGSTTSKFLTNMPRSLTLASTQDIVLNFREASIGGVTTLRKIFVSDLGDSCYNAYGSDTNAQIQSVICGPNNIPSSTNIISGTLPIIKDSTKWVEFYIGNASNVQLTERVRYYIDRRCPINSYQILFMDRLGSFGSFYFPLASTAKGKIERQTYNKKFGSNTGSVITYKSYDSGNTIYTVVLEEELTLNSNWMSIEESIYFEELMTSPYTYIKMPDGNYYACVVQETDFETQSSYSKKLRRKTITVKLSVNKPINI